MRLALLVAYDGREFHGFWPNPGVRTVGGTLGESAERIVGEPVELTCAGRTDSGVHGWGQVVTFDVPDGTDAVAVRDGLNGLRGPEIVVRAAVEVLPDFDARASALSRRYRYTVLNRAVPDPFLAATAWHVPGPLDLRALRLACDPVIGEHDFATFCRRPKPSDPQVEPPSLVRRVLDAAWHDQGDGVLRFEIEASSFCHQMVRSVVGVMVEMGLGRSRPGEMAAVVRAADRQVAPGNLAPPHGLCLWEVRYDPDPFAA